MEDTPKTKKKNTKSCEGCVKSYNKLRRSKGLQYLGNNEKIVNTMVKPPAVVRWHAFNYIKCIFD